MRLANRILELLYDRQGEYVWLDELASGASAALPGVERALTELAARGHRFERSPGRGIRLVRPTVLDAHLVERDLPVERIGRHVICFGQVGSTNEVAFDSAAQAPGQSLVVTAEHQTGGRGRLGRTWLSEPAAGVLASVLLDDPAEALAHDALTVAAGLAVAEGVEQAAGVRTGLEWPNDVVLDGAKLAGVLVEMRRPSRPTRGGASNGAAPRRVVVGFGVNVISAPPAAALGRAATCRADALGVGDSGPAGSGLERTEVLRAVLIRLDHWAGAVRGGLTEPLHRLWLERCAMINRRVTVDCHLPAPPATAGSTGGAGHGTRRVTGRVVDVSPLEGLILLADSGEQLHLPAAMSSIVK